MSDKLRAILKERGFTVKVLARHLGLSVRTLERRFRHQFETAPKAWIIRERMRFAAPMLVEGLSNKQVAASLSYSSESNFCRDFKREFGSAPQEFRKSANPKAMVSHSDKPLARFDKQPELLR